MEKLPPPPPPPPPGRGRAEGPQPPRDHRTGGSDGTRRPGRPSTWPRWLLWVVAGVLLATIFIPSLLPDEKGNELDYTEFRALVVDGDVTSVEVNRTSGKIEGELANGEKFFTNGGTDRGLSEDDEALLREQGVKVKFKTPSSNWLLNVLGLMLPVILIIGFFVWMQRRAAGQMGNVMSIGRSRAKAYNTDKPSTTFADIAGYTGVKQEITEVVDFLRMPERFREIGARVPKGMLLVGPPGTGKTLFARAVAGEAGVGFLSVTGSDFMEMFVGVGASRVRDLFQQARKMGRAIIFVDEIDSIGRKRGAGLGGGHDEREQTLNQLLVEMDGFDQRTAVILMAATNRPDILDPALLRPGRFDRHVTIDRPDLEGRKAILRVHARGKPFDDHVDLDVIARRTPGFTGADLANVINEAALLAARWGKKAISMKEIEEAIDRVMAGPERKSRVMSDREKRVIAYHEGGHALVAHVLPNTDPVHKISVISRGRALGYTLTLPEQDKFLMTREELTDELAMLLGGRVAEEIIVGDITTGAANDIERATKVARQMVTEYGMSDVIGPLTLGQKQHEVFLGRDFQSQPDYSDSVAFEIDNEVRQMIDQAHDEALEILQLHRETLDQLAST
ncbi:MAG TPA: ATP-dependent zinc metalloprotease FtsH, partial [Ilumatobacteraceae bacterium]|nr:ATP-dependent zinc metalloprotease FtsH [Ilumatobacteraceae bacterium]